MASARGTASAALFAAAYLVLVPGLLAPLFSARAEMKLFGMSIKVFDVTKSTVGTIQHLYGLGCPVPATLILVFSVVVPFLKLAAAGLAAYRLGCTSTELPCVRPQKQAGATALGGGEGMVEAIRLVSKWATVDAFCVMTFAGAFAGDARILVSLHVGFYFFLAYCVLSVAAALVLPSGSRRPEALLPPQRPAIVCGPVLLVIVTLWLVLLAMPLVSVDVPEFNLNRRLSVVSLAGALRDAGLLVPASALLVLVALLPGVHAVVAAASTLGLPVPSWALEVGHMAMGDVFLVSTVVTALAAKGLSSRLHVEVLGGARIMLAAILIQPACTWLYRAVTAATARRLEKSEEL